MFFTDDGLIQQSDLREVMKACMEENGMNFDEKVISSFCLKVKTIIISQI